MISVSDVTMRYGSKLLLEEVSIQFIAGRRYGLLARMAQASRPL